MKYGKQLGPYLPKNEWRNKIEKLVRGEKVSQMRQSTPAKHSYNQPERSQRVEVICQRGIVNPSPLVAEKQNTTPYSITPSKEIKILSSWGGNCV